MASQNRAEEAMLESSFDKPQHLLSLFKIIYCVKVQIKYIIYVTNLF